MNYYKSAYQHQKRTTEFTLKSKCTMTEKLPVPSISATSNNENVLASLKKEYDQTILVKNKSFLFIFNRWFLLGKRESHHRT